jgi:hypothetical protein
LEAIGEFSLEKVRLICRDKLEAICTQMHYCTYFDHRYVSLGLALYASMRRRCSAFSLWVLCLTDECYDTVTKLALPDLIPLRLSELEAFDRELLARKESRPTIEYYFTCTPALIRWIFSRRTDIDVLTYLDSDLFFFNDPASLFTDFRDHSIFIVPHRYSPQNAHLARFSGNFNVGWLSFRRDPEGLECLEWWRQSCLKSCARKDGQCGDQMYLNEFPLRFSKVYICDNPGVNLAPWNLDNYRLTADPHGSPEVNGVPVVFFHFSQLRRVARFLWRAPYRIFGVPVTRDVRKFLFRPYLRDIIAAEKLAGYPLPPPALTHGRTFFRAYRFLAVIRELSALPLRGGGIWVFGRRVM